MSSPCFYKIIFKKFYDIASNHANLVQNDAQVFLIMSIRILNIEYNT